jgi:hypothetical protein
MLLGLLALSSVHADSKEEVQIRFQTFAISGDVSEELRLKDDIWAGDKKDWGKFRDAVRLFDSGYLNFGKDSLELQEDEELYWKKTKLNFVDTQKVKLLPGTLQRINTPSILLEKDKSYTIKITSQQFFQYFAKRPDGLFELKIAEDLPTGLDIKIRPKVKDGRIMFDEMLITLRAAGQREQIPGVNLQVGRPVITTDEYKLNLRVRLNETYGILLRMERGQGAVVIFFNTTVVTQPALDTIRRELGNVPYDIRKRAREGKTVYEVDAWIERKQVELNIYRDGKIRNRYEETDFDALPEVIHQAISNNLGKAKIGMIKKRIKDGTITYQVNTERNNKDIILTFAENGKVISK